MLEQKWKEEIESDFELYRKSAKKQQEFLNNSSFCSKGDTLEVTYIPKIYSQKTKQQFEEIITTTYGIFDKMIHHYLESASYRAKFGFPKEIEELILVPNGYDCNLPVARFDIFYHEKDQSFGYCEINADGAGAMNRQVDLNRSLKYNEVYQKLSQEHQITFYDPIEHCINALLNIYATYKDRKENPGIAIIDFVYEGSSLVEWEEFAKRFQKRGYQAQVVDIRQLRYENGILSAPDGMEIDLIYRRAVTTDIIDHFAEVQPFIQAVKDQAVCLMGSFRTQIVHNKMLSVLLGDEETLSLLTDEERAFVKLHFPYTAPLKEEDLAEYIDTKDRWILKPQDEYCCSGIFVGSDLTRQEWETALKTCAKQTYIIQEMYEYEHTPNIDFEEEEPRFGIYINMTGMYVFGGKFGGIFHRQALGNAIISEVNERSLPTVFID